MTRTRAAAATAGVMAGCMAWAWCVDRWPASTVTATWAAALYLKLRAEDVPAAVDG
jgi:hypothetical protein